MSGAEPERDRVFDHSYDGIREYDNPMPRWWVLLFALTVLFCFPYALRYHFGPGPSIYDDLAREKEAYASMLIATYGDLSPDVATLVRYMDDATAMSGMAGLFKGKCAQCHLADGSGSVGPNLTDDSWIHVKSIDDIARVIHDGVPEKGMPAWSEQLTETQIVLLASYVAHLRASPLSGKKPQGEAIPPWPAAGAPPDAPAPEPEPAQEAAGQG